MRTLQVMTPVLVIAVAVAAAADPGGWIVAVTASLVTFAHLSALRAARHLGRAEAYDETANRIAAMRAEFSVNPHHHKEKH